ncbi:MAG: glycoside hydrolase family 15 protein [Clostridiales Family XIII bacterium]|nr:glycoside hydrolase family 15 protein [Clostridiales Family XIII bacterium]
MDGVSYKSLAEYAAALKSGEAPCGKDISFTRTGTGEAYTARVFNDGIAGLLKSDYSRADIESLATATADSRRIGVVTKPWGAFIGAASFESDETAQSTNYDAVWLRDSIWGYLALASSPDRRGDAKAVLLTQLDYMASQAERIDRATASPELLGLPAPDGDMNAVHIRFDSGSEAFADVMSGGEPQMWTHKQNDAIGLLIGAAMDALADGLVRADDLIEARAGSGCTRLAAVVRLVAYLSAVEYYTMEDSGAWEELPRRNTSSIGIVVSALEKLADTLSRDAAFANAYADTAKGLGLEAGTGVSALSGLIAKGYDTVHRQLSLGGESPDYDKSDPHYREADAALLALIYPACPRGLGAREKLAIIGKVGSLAGLYGIRRYERDNYQAGNFWWHDIKTDADPESHKKRAESFIPGTEAEWFFDSWYAKCCLIVADEMEKDAVAASAADGLAADGRVASGLVLNGLAANPDALRADAVKSLNRAFGQITGEGMRSADGKPVPPMASPESYNHIVAPDSNERETWPAPSPIAPLNWAKASLTLMLDEFLYMKS